MSDLKEINQEEKIEEKKRKGISPIVAQDIIAAYNPNATINKKLLVADNEFYRAIHTIVAKKSYSYMPYLIPTTVFHANPKSMVDLSKNHIKLSPYTMFEGACNAAKQMYVNAGTPHPQRVNYRFLLQSYYLYTSLCVGVSPNGSVDLITANENVLKQIPVIKYNEEGVKRRFSMRTDDIGNNIIQCVELIPRVQGYEVRPAIINAGKADYAIMPKAWLDYLVDNINHMLMFVQCKITYINADGKETTIIASNKYDHKVFSERSIKIDYINWQCRKCGVIRCVDSKTGALTVFPITHFISLMPCKEV